MLQVHIHADAHTHTPAAVFTNQFMQPHMAHGPHALMLCHLFFFDSL